MNKLSHLAAWAVVLVMTNYFMPHVVDAADAPDPGNHLLPVKCDTIEHKLAFNTGLVKLLGKVPEMQKEGASDEQIYRVMEANIEQGLEILHCVVVKEDAS